MKKIISVFQRNYEGDRLVRDEVVPGAEWVLAGEGTPTHKWDGTAVLILDGLAYKRHTLKSGKWIPVGFIPADEVDAVTGQQPGWVPVTDAKDDAPCREALVRTVGGPDGLPDGTYELCGPKIGNAGGGNPECFPGHRLIRHGAHPLPDMPRTFDGIREFLAAHAIEGIVFWRAPNNPDCDKAKIKRRDFGLPWPIPTPTPNPGA